MMFHTPSATLFALITGDARLSLNHLDADFGRRSGGRGHKTNDHLLSISQRDPLPLIGKRVRYVTSFQGGGRAAAELCSSAVLRVPRKLPNLLTRKESGPFPEVGWDRDTEAFGHVMDYVSRGG